MRRRQAWLLTVLVAALWSPATLVQAQGTVSPVPRLQFLDNSGNPCASCLVYTYAAGTTTAQATYPTASLTVGTALPNPIVLNSAGRPQTNLGAETNVYLSATSYKFILTSSTGSVIWTADNVTSVPTTSGNLEVTGTAGEALTAGDAVYLSDGSGALVAGRWYKADADFTYASSLAGMVGIAPNAIASAATGTIRIAGRATGLSGLTAGTIYYISATAGALTATAPTNARFVGSADSTTTIVFTADPTYASVIARSMRVNAATPYTLLWPAADASGYLNSNGSGTFAFTSLTLPNGVVEGRLTATTAVPVTSSDVTATANIFYAPYIGNRIALYDGSSTWNVRTFSEITISVSACTASKPYDVFLYDNATVVTAEILVWTNATTRATALTRQDGVLVKTGATTRRFVGSFYCNASGGQTDDAKAKRTLCNQYNRRTRSLLRLETNATWNYTTATIRQANGSTLNQVEVMSCNGENNVDLLVNNVVYNGTGSPAVALGIGEDSTTTFSANQNGISSADMETGTYNPIAARLNVIPTAGYHVFQWNEYSEATGTTQWECRPVASSFCGLSGGTEN